MFFISGALGIPNRVVKSQNLIVLNKTSMPAILIECLFADSSDTGKYNAKAIADGLVGVGNNVGNVCSGSGSSGQANSS
ncbi:MULTISPECIES: N-acetylmuramoyl-L-alanine amidase [Clostridium]|uniref:N-acetylmuramoyl-L-alanine amidase n=1 Tax=Clostridium TaxID=1485 RepID=UPI002DD43995|nr:N-acetylmuramoyl-L-alanine amidase [Clostridium butyricum]